MLANYRKIRLKCTKFEAIDLSGKCLHSLFTINITINSDKTTLSIRSTDYNRLFIISSNKIELFTCYQMNDWMIKWMNEWMNEVGKNHCSRYERFQLFMDSILLFLIKTFRSGRHSGTKQSEWIISLHVQCLFG